ncbi:stress responsive A/B barrel domain-containing protein [Lineolata rhizophorae]|uniref:Stress responsive A/B barrel domain-containing protein n=1 Tax=Lineolata rhizophorae TaxID=578093 RepID=A0A6A6NT78_9PEZI|nr:stress responsive A/B barrel domain-containing protein [Lineolata rhizophorae]
MHTKIKANRDKISPVSIMAIIHIVMFQFKNSASADEVQDACSRMLALRDTCVHPTSKQPYIKTAMGGRDNSPEGMQGGLTHAFIVEFSNEEDRRYYLEEDAAHQAFVASIKDMLAQLRVVDFTPGVF